MLRYAKEDKWIISAGSEDSSLQINKVQWNKKGFELEKYFKMELSSFCTSISQIKNYGFLSIGCRDGSIFILDAKNTK